MRAPFFYSTLAFLFLLAFWARLSMPEAGQTLPLPASPTRIVSLAPSATELVYALGLGDKVVGVTQFCAYPAEVRNKPQVAGFSEVNYEAVLRLRPDLVVLPRDKERHRQELQALGLAALPLDTRSLKGLLEAIKTLGEAIGHQQESGRILRTIEDSLVTARQRATGRARPTVLFSIMHAYQGLGYITEINAVGKDGFYSELISSAGGCNVYAGGLAFPRLSREAIITLDPEVIIDVVPASEDLEGIRREWQSLTSVSAIRKGRLHLLTDEADTVPGPRVHQTLTRLSHILHPDAGTREGE